VTFLRTAPVLVAAFAALAVAGLGALVTDLGPWYESLRKPAWQPPDALFGPAWTLIFGLAALAGVRLWRALPERPARILLLAMFAVNGALNILWSYLFFTARRPDWALLEVSLLWVSILLLIAYASRASRSAAWLLVPYLAWVGFAGVLNLQVVRMNAPFGS
jgi:translocator protein